MTESEEDDLDTLQEAAIGKFVVWFERINMAINESIHAIAEKKGIKDNDFIYIEILLHDATAYSMMNYFKGYVIHYFEKDMEDPKISKSFHKIMEYLKDVIEFRNILLHSTFHFLDNDEEGEIIYRWTAKRFGINKSGLHYKIEEANEDLIKLIKKKSSICWYLYQLFHYLPFIVIPDDQPLSYFLNEELIKGIEKIYKGEDEV